MTREWQSIPDKLRALTRDESAALNAYRKFTQDTDDPTAQVVLAMLIRETDHDQSLLRRAAAGALDALDWKTASSMHSRACPRDVASLAADMRTASRSARARAQQLRDLACSARGLQNQGLAMFLDAFAMNGDKHAYLLGRLAYHIESCCRESAKDRTPELRDLPIDPHKVITR